jgi:AcrR family transcriptional regulator
VLDEESFRSEVRILPQRPRAVLEPRKAPVQARSAASVNAILEATIQVLRDVGKERLTTTRVAARAGVSVGTLYQYFPNKSALLQAVLRRHFKEITDAIETVCQDQKGKSLSQMATALITVFLEAKLRNAKTSVALYTVSDDLDGAKIVHQMGSRSNKAIVEMLKTAREHLATDPQVVASMLQGAMFGVSRRMLESGSPEKQFEILQQGSWSWHAHTSKHVPRVSRLTAQVLDQSAWRLFERRGRSEVELVGENTPRFAQQLSL